MDLKHKSKLLTNNIDKIMRMIALIIFIAWAMLTCVPALLSSGIVGYDKTEKWFYPILDWCIERME